MGKETTTITLDSEMKKKAKKLGINISALTERAIKEKAGMVEINMNADSCDFCHKEMLKASAKKPHIGLTLIMPDEKWICHNCLRRRT